MTYQEDQEDFSSSYSPELRDQLLAAAIFSENKALNDIKQDIFSALMTRVREELLSKMDQLRMRVRNYPHSRPVIEMLLEKLSSFANDTHMPYHVDFFKRIVYRLELVDKLEKIDWTNTEINVFPPVDELLIYMNYNSKTYMKLLQNWLAKRIGEGVNPKAKIEKMNYYQKVFQQLHTKKDTVLYEDYHSLQELLKKWFDHEGQYLERQKELFKETDIDQIIEDQERSRLKLSISSDQLALIIRAAEDTRLVLARSINSAFQTIVPFLSTKNRDKLSPTSVRTKSYNAEQTDKEAVILALQKMISRIRDY